MEAGLSPGSLALGILHPLLPTISGQQGRVSPGFLGSTDWGRGDRHTRLVLISLGVTECQGWMVPL